MAFVLAWGVLGLLGVRGPRSRRVALAVIAVTFYPAVASGVLAVVLALAGDAEASAPLGVMTVVLALVVARSSATGEDFPLRGPTERYLRSPVHGPRPVTGDRVAS